MADCDIPLRGGPTLGDYYEWSGLLYQSLLECNARQQAEREFYNGKESGND